MEPLIEFLWHFNVGITDEEKEGRVGSVQISRSEAIRCHRPTVNNAMKCNAIVFLPIQ